MENRSKGGRSAKRPGQAEANARRHLNRNDISDAQQMELLSIIAELFCLGINTKEGVTEQIQQRFPHPYAKLVRGERYWDLVRLAASKGLFHHQPSIADHEEPKLFQTAAWLRGHVTIVRTAALETLATAAAERLLGLIREAAVRDRTVHVGFAGGRTLRLIAEKLAPMLCVDHRDNPHTLVFHAMVAGFDEDDFSLDPNSFINCFVNCGTPINIRLVRLPMPGILTSEEYEQTRRMPSIARVIESASEIQIVVSSGSLLGDHSSTIQAFIDHLSQSEHSDQVAEIVKLYENEGVVGDMLWQPVTENGPLKIETPFRVATLMPLYELQQFIKASHQRRVMLVLGRSGISGVPKSKLLHALLQVEERLFTDLVVDTPTLNGYLNPDVLSQYMPPPPDQPR